MQDEPIADPDGPAGLPVIDVAPLARGGPAAACAAVAGQIQAACRERGFFYVTGHGVPAGLLDQLGDAAAEFFALPAAAKMEIAMERGGRAWRGYFPVGAELTSGRPDLKEGLYFGAELPADDPRVLAGLPLHGGNLFPRQVPRLRSLVLAYLDALTSLGQTVLRGVALSLGLDAGYFAEGYTADPTVLFRIFHYPPSDDDGWGVGEHTDYGLLTLLAQDDSGGLQVAAPEGWVAAPPLPGTFVCNIGDMLDRMTGGLYRSTPHRVKNPVPRDRLSLPFFFDPNFFARVQPIALPGRGVRPDDRDERWDRASVHAFEGTYGDYLLGKVGKVFPELRSAVL